MVILCQPHREDIEFLIAGEHRVERREVSKRLLHHLGASVHKDAMHSGRDALKLFRTARCDQEPEREFALRLLVEGTDDIAEIVYVVVGSPCPGARI